MKLAFLEVSRFRSLRHIELALAPLNVLIGTNASGKSNILDTLRFLSEAIRNKNFSDAVASRGNIVHLAWKGEEANEISLIARFSDAEQEFIWSVSLSRFGRDFAVKEEVQRVLSNDAPQLLLTADRGRGWWWSGEESKKIPLSLTATECSLAAAAADASFPARGLVEFIGGWGFFDPSPTMLRKASFPPDTGTRLDHLGGNLAVRLYSLKQENPEVFNRILSATRSVLGVPEDLDFFESDYDGRIFFTQKEPGLKFTHSPLLLNCLDAPEAICIVRRSAQGTETERENNPEAVRRALQESGFGLGEFYETKGFGV